MRAASSSWVVFIAWLCLLPIASAAQTSPDARSVEVALNEFLANVDQREAHERFWSDDLIYTSSSGERFGKSRILSGFDADAPPTSDPNAPRYSAEQVEIRFENGLALLTFMLIAETPGQDSSLVQRYFNSGVLEHSSIEGQPPIWRAMLWQATRIPEPETGDVGQQ